MANLEKVGIAVSKWAFNVAKSVLPQVGIPADSAVGKFMYGILGVNPSTYNLWNELGFLAEPLIQTMVTPAVGKMLGGIPDEQIPDLAIKFADSFIEQARKKGSVNLFGLELGANAFEGLKGLLTEQFEEA